MLKIFARAFIITAVDVQDAISLMSKVLEEHPEMDGIRPLYAIYLACRRPREDTPAQLSEDRLALSRADHDMASWVGSTYSILGDEDLAFKSLDPAIKLGDQNWPHFEHDKSLDPAPRRSTILQSVSRSCGMAVDRNTEPSGAYSRPRSGRLPLLVYTRVFLPVLANEIRTVRRFVFLMLSLAALACPSAVFGQAELPVLSDPGLG